MNRLCMNEVWESSIGIVYDHIWTHINTNTNTFILHHIFTMCSEVHQWSNECHKTNDVVTWIQYNIDMYCGVWILWFDEQVSNHISVQGGESLVLTIYKSYMNHILHNLMGSYVIIYELISDITDWLWFKYQSYII